MVTLATAEHAPASGEADPLDEPLLFWGQRYWEENPKNPHSGPPTDPWRFREAFEGTQVFGGTGSGKTSGSGRTMALALLTAKFRGRHRFGGLVLCAKPDEAALWANFNPDLLDASGERVGLGYCALAGRRPKDVLVFGVNHKHYRDDLKLPDRARGVCFDFLGYMSALGGSGAGRGAAFTQTIVNLFQTVLEGGAQASSSADPYWDDAIRQMLTNAVELIMLARDAVEGLSVSIAEINGIILSAPQSRDQASSQAFQKGRCWTLLQAAEEWTRRQLEKSPPGDPGRAELLRRRRDLQLTIDYWLRDFAGLSDRVRSVVESSFTAKATAMLRRPICDLFSPSTSGAEPVTPDMTHRGQVIVLDLSPKEYGEVGRFAQVLFKTVWQRATEHPARREHPHPVFLWADESQHFVTSEDAVFQQTARSNHAATVYMTQNISNYYVALAGRAGNAATDSLIGNFQTKVFHANGDPATNEWAERLFAYEKKIMLGTNTGSSGNTDSDNQAWLPAVPASEFMRLRKGGKSKEVDAVVFVSGHAWERPSEQRGMAAPRGLVARPGVRVTFQQGVLPRPERGPTPR